MDPVLAGGTVVAVLGIVGGALLSEDAATIAAASLAASQLLDAKVAFLGAFLGLWIGDLGVYLLARGIRGGAAPNSWLTRWISRPSQAEAAGGWPLAVSRFFPGTRLPAYVSAGLRRMPIPRFAAITALSAFLWVVLVFVLVDLMPAHAGVLETRLAWASFAGLFLFAGFKVWSRFSERAREFMRRSTARLLRWEFWPAWVFYTPVAALCAWLGLRYRGFSLPTIANLNQKNGGIVGESKIEILRQLAATSPEFTVESHAIEIGPLENRLARAREILRNAETGFPFVLKPDIGQRGAGFKKFSSWSEVERYLRDVPVRVILQRYVAGPKEAGIFFYRFPGALRGEIFGITRKEFPCVTGDGSSTLRALIERDRRARFMMKAYLKRFRGEADCVLAAGEQVRLVEAGNHCQGCEFRDGSDLYTEELRAGFDSISRLLPGFHVGRFDIRYESDEKLRLGRGFQIIELNGAASEATNIYDSRNSLFSAYATLYRQWQLVYKIGAENRRRGFKPTSLLAVWNDWKEFAADSCNFPVAD